MSYCIRLLNTMVWMVFPQTTGAKWLERNYYSKSTVAFVGAKGSMSRHSSSASNSSKEKLFATKYDATLGATPLREDIIGRPVVQSSSPNSSTAFDSVCVANPVVLPPNSNDEKMIELKEETLHFMLILFFISVTLCHGLTSYSYITHLIWITFYLGHPVHWICAIYSGWIS